MNNIDITNNELIKLAKEAFTHSYSPYSNFKVGAALVTDKGNIYTGCNIENASYGATVCAERVAIFKAVSNDDNNILRIAIACSENTKAVPCGICLQVMSEFMKHGSILLCDEQGIYEYSLDHLLPLSFTL